MASRKIWRRSSQRSLGAICSSWGQARGVRFDLKDFYELVSKREGVDVPKAACHVRAVASVLREAVSPGEWEDVLAQLPTDYDRILESGSEGEAPRV